MSKTFLVFGDSPTMLKIVDSIPLLLSKFKTIFINRTKYKGDFVIGIDDNTWRNIETKIKTGILPKDYSKWVAPKRLEHVVDIPFYMTFETDSNIDRDNDHKFFTGPNSLISALNLAYEEGATRIIIVACELIRGVPHATNPNQIFNPRDYDSKIRVIKRDINRYKEVVELLQIADINHVLDIPVITVEEALKLED